MLTRKCRAFDPPIGAGGLDWGLGTALVPLSRPLSFARAPIVSVDGRRSCPLS